jgi:hypothetical protein
MKCLSRVFGKLLIKLYEPTANKIQDVTKTQFGNSVYCIINYTLYGLRPVIPGFSFFD